MTETRASNPLVEQFRKGGTPRDLRLMAAQGTLPLAPLDLLELLLLLTGDGDAEVSDAATRTLVERPVDELAPIARDRATPPGLLSWILGNRKEREVLEPALQNVTTPDEAIESVAPRLPTELAELVVINQTRLLRRTSLLEAIESNPSLNRDQQRRLYELRESFHIGAEHAEQTPPSAPPPPVAEPAPPAEAAAAPEELAEEPEPASEEEAIARLLSPEERGEPEKLSVVQRLYRMNTAQKIIQALKGNREDRAILVRDPNRLISMAVLGSPRLTETEIESFAGMKNVSAEVLRAIGNHREWTKKYGVISSLVRNPRTPLGVSLGMISRLNPRDVKGLSIDRNVPEVIRKQAKKFVKEPGAARR
jgi:hypothetical protein